MQKKFSCIIHVIHLGGTKKPVVYQLPGDNVY